MLERHGARSAPALVYGFPGAICISVNDEAVHGVPGPRRLAAGDAVTLDVTAELGGYMADAAVTVVVPPRAARAGRPLNAIGRAVGRSVETAGFAVLRPFTGHGIGRTIHEAPDILNYDEPRNRGRLTPGLVITIEPIISARGQALRQDADGWTVRTRDGSLTAHAEHTVIVTRRGSPLVLTSGV